MLVGSKRNVSQKLSVIVSCDLVKVKSTYKMVDLLWFHFYHHFFMVFTWCVFKDMHSIPGSGRPPGGGDGNPLQYSCWKIPWTEKPGGLYSPRGLKRVGHDWATKHTCTHTHRARKWLLIRQKILWAVSSLLHKLLSETNMLVARTATRRDGSLGGLNNRRMFFSQYWRLGVWGQGVGKVGSLLGLWEKGLLQNSLSWLKDGCPHIIFPLCVSMSKFPLLMKISVILD